MPQASRSIVVPLASDVHVAFDAALLRTHAAWTGEPLNLYGPPYHGKTDRFICDFTGAKLWGNPPFYPWSVGGPPANDATELPAGAGFRAISTKGGTVTLSYDVAIGEGKSVRVQETPFHRRVEAQDVVVRRFTVAPCKQVLWLLAHAELGHLPDPPTPPAAALIERSGDVLLSVLREPGGCRWHALEKDVSYVEEVITEKGTEEGNPKVPVTGRQARLYVTVAAHAREVTFDVLSVVCRDREEANSFASLVLDPHSETAKSLATPEPKIERDTTAATAFTADASAPTRLDGDEFYRVEHFPLPKEAGLLITGMDWLSNGDLAVCTWRGDVFIVQGAQGSAASATYRRFARGLCEPLGLKVIKDQIYVAQKCELTRLLDTDRDGEADRYECVSDALGYSGNYHSYVFGPVVDRRGNFYVFPCGQRARWDLPFGGWAVKISSDEREVEGFCSGLRVANGVGSYGRRGDLFMTDNQGNWVGTCKLNHLQRGKFYGFPSASPAPREDWDQPKDCAPPAVWFPRRLSLSASGFDTISDDRFGPFKGQMLVGDFQNSFVMRVFLEKVDGQWQGAVWPFVRGFGSGVNRLLFGADGRLYVGGCKGAHWSSALGPKDYSLDRVSWTGKVPFEVKEVRARASGFDLVFTQPVDAKDAADPSRYEGAQFNYRPHQPYGSPEFDHEGRENSATPIPVAKATVSANGLRVTLRLEGLRAGYVTQFVCREITNVQGVPLRYGTFYYTLNQVPK